ncbi:MAG: hypothetical protein JNN19_13470 [Bacteroidia bacterium]|nr:hypothetical protein [Bacteroidia bacterium]
MVRWLILVLFALSEAGTSLARPDTTAPRRVIPVEVYAQFAGGQGMWSAGIVATPFKSAELTLGLGYTPPAFGKIYTVTTKLLFVPRSIRLRDRLHLLPIKAGVHGAFHLSRETGLQWDRNKYPRGYYWWPVSFRTGPVFQFALQWRTRQYLLTPYYELSTNDL